MQPLRLEISAGYRTARRSQRRAVWQWVGIAVFLLLFWGGTHTINTRSSLTKFVPANRVASIYVRPNRHQWKELDRILGSEPILPSLNFTQVNSFSWFHNELAIHILKNGDRILALQGSMPETVRAQIESAGFTVSNPSQKTTLISTTNESTELISEKAPFLARFSPMYFGFFVTNTSRSPLYLKRGSVLFSPEEELPNLSQHNDAAWLELSANSSFLAENQQMIPAFLVPLFGQSSEVHFLTDGATEIFSPNPLPQESLDSLVLHLNAVYRIGESPRKLPDGSFVDEIRLGATESNDQSVWKSELDTQTYETTHFVIQTSQQGTTLTIKPSRVVPLTKVVREPGCDGSVGFIDLSYLFKELQSGNTNLSTQLPFQNSLFVQAGIDKRIFKDQITLCFVDNVDKSAHDVNNTEN